MQQNLRDQMCERSATWRFPLYRRILLQEDYVPPDHVPNAWLAPAPLRLLPPASFIEWRYLSILSPAFHGIAGMSFVNPFNLFGGLAESGLLFILAGVFDKHPQTFAQPHDAIQELCWMHLFPSESLTFSGTDSNYTIVEGMHEGVRLRVEQQSPQVGTVMCETDGLCVQLHHQGVPGLECDPCYAHDLARTPEAHWIVYNPSPVAQVSGVIDLDASFFAHLPPRSATSFPNYAARSLQQTAPKHVALHHEAGYYEHSFGINPLFLHGWDFLFAPDASRRQGVVLQTYRHSTTLRYLDVFWYEDDRPHNIRFHAHELSLEWRETCLHPDTKTILPTRRVIIARNNQFALELDTIILHHIPFLRPQTFVVRHFFIVEEISETTWCLRDQYGRVRAGADRQPSGGEVAFPRWSC